MKERERQSPKSIPDNDLLRMQKEMVYRELYLLSIEDTKKFENFIKESREKIELAQDIFVISEKLKEKKQELENLNSKNNKNQNNMKVELRGVIHRENLDAINEIVDMTEVMPFSGMKQALKDHLSNDNYQMLIVHFGGGHISVLCTIERKEILFITKNQ